MVDLGIGHTYREFLEIVAANRKSTPEKVNEVAQGRVWTGTQAKERSLVDGLGGLNESVKAAARRAGLPDGARVQYVEPERRGLDRYLSFFMGQLGAALRDDLGWDGLARTLAGSLPAPAPRQLGLLLEAREHPTRALAYCFCDLR